MMDDMEWLDQELHLLAQTIAYPATPSLAQAVRRRLESEGARPVARRPWAVPTGRQALAGLAAAMAVVAVALALGLSAPARDAVADFFDRINIFRTEEPPAGLPTDITGTPVTLTEVEARLGFPLKLPTYPKGIESSLTEVLLQEFADVKAAVLVFEHPTGLSFALFQTNAGVGKGLAPGAQAEPVAGLGSKAYWLRGLRIVQYYDPEGNVIQESLRQTEASTLIWDARGVVFRLEGDLSQEEAVRIAQSLR